MTTTGALGPWKVNTSGALALRITGDAPVPLVVVDLTADNRPAWSFVVDDARQASTYWLPLGPRAGTFDVIVRATDTRGCEGVLLPRPSVVVQP